MENISTVRDKHLSLWQSALDAVISRRNGTASAARVALISDWGTGTEAAKKLLCQLANHKGVALLEPNIILYSQ